MSHIKFDKLCTNLSIKKKFKNTLEIYQWSACALAPRQQRYMTGRLREEKERKGVSPKLKCFLIGKG